MKIIETGPREIGFVLWGHCQNLLDDPRILHFWHCLANAIKNHTFASLTSGSEHLLKYVTYVTWHNE